MNREEQYIELLHELETTPDSLNDIVGRANRRLKASHRKTFIILPFSFIASIFLVFTVLINTVPTFARACSTLPILSDLSEFVSFSSSLSSAVDHDYVQQINQEQTKDEITASIKYVIVDQKQVNVFYNLNSSIYKNLEVQSEASKEDGSPLKDYFLTSAYYGEGNDDLRMFTINFVNDVDVPNRIVITMRIQGNENWNTLYSKENMFNHKEEIKELGEFTFLLHFDPNYTGKGDITLINKSFEVDGQTLILEQTGVYPTHVRLDFGEFLVILHG